MKIIPVIMCGGAGTRLWSQSKRNMPKQFIDWGGWTLFGRTLERIKNEIFDYPIISTNSAYLNLVKLHLKKHNFKKYKIVLEPFKKNTAPAVLSSALIEDIPFNQPMIFITSDNLISEIDKFNKSILLHKKYLDGDNIFIFGIKTRSPSPQYGYFLSKKKSKQINKVTKFIEKPNKGKIKLILKENGYMNGGMFFLRKDSLIKNFIKHQLQIFNCCFNSMNKAKINKNVYFLNKKEFKKVKDISFDYAVLEKSNNINAIKLNLSLTDLGNWKEIWKYFKKYRKKIYIKKNTFYRPWGKYINLFSGNNFLLKELLINSYSSISLQKHKYRSERWIIISGTPKVTINKKTFLLKANDSVSVPKGSIHRIENPFNKPVQIVEVQTGSILKENDIIRYKDIYGRVS